MNKKKKPKFTRKEVDVPCKYCKGKGTRKEYYYILEYKGQAFLVDTIK